MDQKERELFLELCKITSPNKEKIKKLLEDGAATYEVLGMLFDNRMAGGAYHVLQQTNLFDKRQYHSNRNDIAFFTLISIVEIS